MPGDQVPGDPMPSVLVAGVGNIFLSDDGFGPAVARALAAPDAPPFPPDVRVVDYGIRGMHLAYDLLPGYDGLVLVDTLPGGNQPGEVQVLQVGVDDLGAGEFDAHGMDPVAVLAHLDSLGGVLPVTYVVGCSPANLEEGIGLSEPVAVAVPKAAAIVRTLVAERLLRHGALPGRRS